jgi:hypothetical protein
MNDLINIAVFVTGVAIVVGLYAFAIHSALRTINDSVSAGEVILYVVGVLVIFASIAFYGTLWHY